MSVTPYSQRGSRSNPRPTRRPGATDGGGRSHIGTVGGVPILARPGGRAQLPAMALIRRNLCTTRSNPRPTRRPGATLVAPAAEPRQNMEGSNPRPTRRPGATGNGSYALRDTSIAMFQSSPDPEAGRNQTAIAAKRSTEPGGFQSSPDPEAGRNHAVTAFRTPIPMFQSSPDPEAGRNILRASVWRARRGSNPRPTRRPGATGFVAAVVASVRRQFQSSPDPEAGRNPELCGRKLISRRSNPRPTRRPGATRSSLCWSYSP